MTLFIHTLYLLFNRQTYDLELYTLAEHKMEFFFQQNAASINRVMSKGVATNPAGLKKETKEELQCCVKATII